MASATDEGHLPDVRCVWVFCYVAELSQTAIELCLCRLASV